MLNILWGGLYYSITRYLVSSIWLQNLAENDVFVYRGGPPIMCTMELYALRGCICIFKGQLISKCLFGVFNSPIKQTKTIRLEVP